MDIFLASNRAKEVCDFRIKCTFYEGSADIYLGNSNTVIAQVKRKINLSVYILMASINK